MIELRPNRKIKSVHIKNVNNHEESVYNFDPHINLIVGSSENGKSASIRGIVFALYNIYNGDLVNWDQKFAQVTVEYFDGAILKRTKGKDINRVEFKYPGQQEFTIYKSFGSDYPQEVWDFLGNPPTYIDSKPIAYGDQHSKTFLVDLKPTQLPSVFSQLTGVEDLEECSSLCNSKIKGFEKSNKALDNEIKELETKLETDFVGLDEKILQLEKLRTLLDEMAETELEITGLFSVQKDYKRIISAGQEAANEISRCKKIIETIPDLTSLNKDFSTLQAMQNAQNYAEKTERKIAKYEKRIKIDRVISKGDFADLISACDEQYSLILNMTRVLNTADSLQDKISKKESTIKDIKTNIKEKTDEYNSVREEAISKGAVCGECMKIGGEYVG
jgi:exonuclease SbcC